MHSFQSHWDRLPQETKHYITSLAVKQRIIERRNDKLLCMLNDEIVYRRKLGQIWWIKDIRVEDEFDEDWEYKTYRRIFGCYYNFRSEYCKIYLGSTFENAVKYAECKDTIIRVRNQMHLRDSYDFYRSDLSFGQVWHGD